MTKKKNKSAPASPAAQAGEYPKENIKAASPDGQKAEGAVRVAVSEPKNRGTEAAEETKPIKVKKVTVVTEAPEKTVPSADSVPIADPVITVDIGSDGEGGRGKKKGKKNPGLDGMVVGVDVVSEAPGKETLSLQLDPKKLKKIQAEQIREQKKQSRKKTVEKLGKSVSNRIREGVKDDAPKSGDKDHDIRAYSLEMHFINVVAMILVFAVVSITLIVVKRESGVSEHENRELATFPTLSLSSWFDGSFTAGVTEFYTDTVPYRDSMLSFASSLSRLFGVSFGEGGHKIIGNQGDIETQTLTGTVTTQAVEIFTGTPPAVTSNTTSGTNSATGSTTPVTTLPVDDPNDGKLSNGIMIVGSGKNVRALECYGGSFSYGKKYAEYVNKYKQDLGQYVNVYSMNIPTAFAYYCPEKFRDEYGSTTDNIGNIRNHLSGVVDIDVYSVLNGHKNEYIYSRTDHHWQPLGAYYAAQEFAKVSQVPFSDLATYEKVVEDDFVGTLYAYSNYDPELAANPDTFTYYKPSNNSKLEVTYYDTNYKNPQRSQLFFKAYQKINLYSSFLGNDKQVAEIKTDCDNGRVLVIFKDSFGNALVPFLTGSFSRIYVVDLRYFTPNSIEFCQNVGATDVLFATCMFTCTSNKANYIENLRIQNKTN